MQTTGQVEAVGRGFRNVIRFKDAKSGNIVACDTHRAMGESCMEANLVGERDDANETTEFASIRISFLDGARDNVDSHCTLVSGLFFNHEC